MREILFRGKRLNDEENEWAYGSYVKQYECDMIYFPTTESDGFDYAHIIPETVGQYTGLTDKNGTKIFEGDILEIHSSKVGKYKALICCGNQWGKSAFILSYRGTAWDYMTVLNDPFKHIKFYTVIGNIHDNPELLNN